MALMRYYIDKRTIANIAQGGTVTYAHGLPGAPDIVSIRMIATQASVTGWLGITAPIDATNVTLQNCGGGAGSGTIEVTAVRFHSIMQ
jgi:hypothetical protein